MKALTKGELLELGVTQVDEDGTVYVNGKVRNPSITTKVCPYGGVKHYLVISLPNKNQKKDTTAKYKSRKTGKVRKFKSWTYASRTLPVARIVLAWYNGIIVQDADHIDNNPFNNNLNNLQELSRKENLAKRLLSHSEINHNYHDVKRKLYKHQF